MRNSIIAIVLFVILFTAAFIGGRYTSPKPTFTTMRDTVPGDSVPYEVKVNVPKPYKVVVRDTFFQQVDTAAILAAYFVTNYYRDTAKNDTSALIVVSTEVTENQILNQSVTFQNRRPTAIIITTTVEVPTSSVHKWQLYGYGVVGKDIAAPMVYVGRDRWLVGGGYNFQQSGMMVGVGYKIW